MGYAVADSIASSADYRRQARRIRASFRGNSFLTQQALGDLAKRFDVEKTREGSGSSAYLRTGVGSVRRAVDDRATLQLEISAVVERGFSEHAATKLQPFGFTYTDRVALLDAGEKLGISRFRANMLLALLENQTEMPRKFIAMAKSTSIVPPLIYVLFIELLAVAASAWIFLK